METPASPSLLEEEAPHVDDAFAESMGFVTTYLRAVESARDDRIVNDPFAGPLTVNHKSKITEIMRGLSRKGQLYRPEDFIAFRTRYLDEAIGQRNPQILQVVILGAGLDARAYRLESLRGCHVLEVDQAQDIFDHKAQVLKGLGAPLVAQKVDYVVSDLAQSFSLENSLLGCGFDPTMPTFWALEGLVPYIERAGVLDLLKVVDHLSAPGSELWVDIPGRFVSDTEEWGKRAMKYGEDDPLNGVLGEIKWDLEVQVSLGVAGDHFGRQWKPMRSPKTNQEVPFFIVVGKK
ncbi:putative O-methyltransferase [Phytophthora cinnamomi]|uniref:putative O-methyltransferase n=1 Tax=Phytophthora cinnamomi TaxID=4785 RepID=UPI002A344DB0|nr:putative O-methyltransferase [Phytophthora cinnamomi]KAJ8548575.1 hypothetical protein ON010_g11100 [Phytophthora cinnamomi]